ncbi:ABC transporter permease [Pedosphaera parvula]|uniref:Oligopeptide transport system permease protein OppC n=1 Tax=Pedosphaera parvula (strain Ellin514) TaxID=320771 RepID=B9XH61_PEDPL|nr:ABC transporter permease [Pedosphaera parvula]EEF60696.1 binding-protein-dependent transport systems inner membrane component [Pedosphaera parvula Ellin514]
MSEPLISPEPKPAATLPGSTGASLTPEPKLNNNPQVHLSPNQKAWRRFKRNRPAVIGAWFLIILVIVVIAWPMVLKVASKSGPRGLAFAVQFDPDKLTDSSFDPPSAQHWFGTDVHGRDLVSRILYGAQVSLLVGGFGALISLIIGVLWGAIAGYLGGRWDNFMMRVVDILYSLPSIIFVIVLITAFEGRIRTFFFDHLAGSNPELANNLVKFTRLFLLIIGLGAVSWLNMARIVRGQVLVLRSRSFVEASKTLGARNRHILRHHILPNVFGVVIVYLTLTVPAIVLYESFLSFLGLGIQPPMASWGSLIAEGADQINTIRVYWWLLAYPGTILIFTLLALNFLGDGLRDAWDVRGDDK